MVEKKRFIVEIVISFILILMLPFAVEAICPYDWQQLLFSTPYREIPAPGCWNSGEPECGDFNEGTHTLLYDLDYDTKPLEDQCYWSECCSASGQVLYTEDCATDMDDDYDEKGGCEDPDCASSSVCQTESISINDFSAEPNYQTDHLEFWADVYTSSGNDNANVFVMVSYDTTFSTNLQRYTLAPDEYRGGGMYRYAAEVPVSTFTSQEFYYYFNASLNTASNATEPEHETLEWCLNGSVWSRPGTTLTCGTDEGICTSGTTTCDYGTWTQCDGTNGTAEECNGYDDDCDGDTDEGTLCPAGSSCVSGTCSLDGSGCDNACETSEIGRLICGHDNNTYSCEEDPNGCTVWEPHETCDGACDNTTATCVCQDDCTEGGYYCDGNDRYLCKRNPADGCLDSFFQNLCELGCDNGVCNQDLTTPGSCDPACTAGDLPYCANNVRYACVENTALGCYEWTSNQCAVYCYQDSANTISGCVEQCLDIAGASICTAGEQCWDETLTTQISSPVQIAADLCCPEGVCYRPPEQVVCNDTDGGRVSATQGIVTLGEESIADRCDGTDLIEYSCVDNQITTERISCDFGCTAGECNDPPTNLPPGERLDNLVEQFPNRIEVRETEVIDLFTYISEIDGSIGRDDMQISMRLVDLAASTQPELGEGGVWQTDFDSAGIYNPIISFALGNARRQANVRIQVADRNRLPRILFDERHHEVREGEPFRLQVQVTDPDNDPVQLSLRQQPDRFNPELLLSDQTVFWNNTVVGRYVFILVAFDSKTEVEEEITLEVRPPTASGELLGSQSAPSDILKKDIRVMIADLEEEGVSVEERKELAKDPERLKEKLAEINLAREEQAKEVIDKVLRKDPSINRPDKIKQFKETRPNIKITKTPAIDRERKETTITIKLAPKKVMYNVSIFEDIPKEIAKSAADLIFSVQPVIIEDDPLIMWQFERLEAPVELSYTVKGEVEVVNTTTIPIAEEVTLEEIKQPQVLWRLALIPIVGVILIFFSRFQKHDLKKAQKTIEKESKEMIGYLEKLSNYIAMELERGLSTDQIKDQLQRMGHKLDMIEKAFRTAKK